MPNVKAQVDKPWIGIHAALKGFAKKRQVEDKYHRPKRTWIYLSHLQTWYGYLPRLWPTIISRILLEGIIENGFPELSKIARGTISKNFWSKHVKHTKFHHILRHLIRILTEKCSCNSIPITGRTTSNRFSKRQASWYDHNIIWREPGFSNRKQICPILCQFWNMMPMYLVIMNM